jgi:hypothetical protein
LSNLDELPDLAGDVRDRVTIPPYAEVSRRVRARRLRGTVGAMGVAAVVVGSLAVWQSVATTTGPSRPEPAGTTQGPVPPTDEAQWQAVVDGTDSSPFETEGTDDGSIAVVWRALEPGSPTFALVIRQADGSVHGMRLESPVSLTPVPGGWVGMDGSRGHLIGSDGSWTDLDETAARLPRAGDVVVSGQYSRWLYSPSDQRLSELPDLAGDVADAYVTPDGLLMTCRWNGRNQIFFSPSDILRQGVPGKTCVIAGRGDDLAIVGLGDDPDGGIPMTGLMTYTDPTWHYPSLDLLPGVSSVVVTPGGSTVVTDAGDGRWLLVRPDGRVTTPDRKVGQAFVAGDRLYVSSYGFTDGPLSYSEDDGRTWTETTLPGNESKEG